MWVTSVSYTHLRQGSGSGPYFHHAVLCLNFKLAHNPARHIFIRDVYKRQAMFMLAFGFGFGAQIIIARRNGERRYNRIGPTMIQGCYFMLALAVVLFTASQYFSPIILRDIICLLYTSWSSIR